MGRFNDLGAAFLGSFTVVLFGSLIFAVVLFAAGFVSGAIPFVLYGSFVLGFVISFFCGVASLTETLKKLKRRECIEIGLGTVGGTLFGGWSVCIVLGFPIAANTALLATISVAAFFLGRYATHWVEKRDRKAKSNLAAGLRD